MTQDLVTSVNAQLAAQPTYAESMPSDQAQDEFLELVLYAERVPEIATALQVFVARGLPVIVSTRTSDLHSVRYQLHETLAPILVAARAGQVLGDAQ